MIQKSLMIVLQSTVSLYHCIAEQESWIFNSYSLCCICSGFSCMDFISFFLGIVYIALTLPRCLTALAEGT